MSAPPASTSASSIPIGSKSNTLYYLIDEDAHFVSALATADIPEHPKGFRATLNKFVELDLDEKWKDDQSGDFTMVARSISSRFTNPRVRTTRKINGWKFVKVDAKTMTDLEKDPQCYPVISRQDPSNAKACFERTTKASGSTAPTQSDTKTFAQTVPDDPKSFMPDGSFIYMSPGEAVQGTLAGVNRMIVYNLSSECHMQSLPLEPALSH